MCNVHHFPPFLYCQLAIPPQIFDQMLLPTSVFILAIILSAWALLNDTILDAANFSQPHPLNELLCSLSEYLLSPHVIQIDSVVLTSGLCEVRSSLEGLFVQLLDEDSSLSLKVRKLESDCII